MLISMIFLLQNHWNLNNFINFNFFKMKLRNVRMWRGSQLILIKLKLVL